MTLGLFVIVQMTSGKGTETEAGGNASSSQSGAVKTSGDSAMKGPAVLGTPVRDGKFEFTPTKVTCGIPSVGSQYLAEKAQGQFCVLELTVKNIGDKPQMFSDSAQKAYAGSTEFSSSSSAAIKYASEKGLDASNWLKDINPGNKMAAVVLYDIPSDAKIDKLKLHDSVFSGGVEVKP